LLNFVISPGKQGLTMMNEFHWLKVNAYVLSGNKKGPASDKTEIQEWFERKKKFLKLCESVFVLTKKIETCVNQELCHDLYTYCWEISTVVSICSSYVKWLSLGEFPANSNSYIQGSYTWFSKGWKETFMSGDQEPWIFRGGLLVDIQRLVPIDSGNDLFIYKLPESPTPNLFSIRPYLNQDEREVYKICHQTCRDGSDCTELFPQSLQEIPSDRLVAPFIILNPEFCMVVENMKKNIIGYACAAPEAKHFYRSQEVGINLL
jgi:protein O-GlcNAcase / histone acetyltransferase